MPRRSRMRFLPDDGASEVIGQARAHSVQCQVWIIRDKRLSALIRYADLRSQAPPRVPLKLGLDLLVSNAGTLTPGSFETLPLAAVRHEFEVNVFSA